MKSDQQGKEEFQVTKEKKNRIFLLKNLQNLLLDSFEGGKEFQSEYYKINTGKQCY